jgi:hypothetical protein
MNSYNTSSIGNDNSKLSIERLKIQSLGSRSQTIDQIQMKEGESNYFLSQER